MIDDAGRAIGSGCSLRQHTVVEVGLEAGGHDLLTRYQWCSVALADAAGAPRVAAAGGDQRQHDRDARRHSAATLAEVAALTIGSCLHAPKANRYRRATPEPDRESEVDR